MARIKIATVSMSDFMPKNKDDNFRHVIVTAKQIATIKPDIIVLPEVFPVSNLSNKIVKVAAEDSKFMISLAKQYKTYVIGSIYTKREGNIYNTALVVNRNGKIIGKYDKIHPTEGEIAKGISAGALNQLPIETEFGKIGIQICFDANWHENWKRLVDNGAKIIFFISAFPGGELLNSIALLNQVYIVASIWSRYSGIIDNTGKWVVKTDSVVWWVWANIDLDRTVFHYDYQGNKLNDIRKEYGDKIKIESFGPEALFTLESQSKEVSIPQIIKEFKLVTYKDYLKRAEKVCSKTRE